MKPKDIPASVWEFAEIAMDEQRDEPDDRAMVARCIMSWEARKTPVSGLTQKQSDALQFIKGYIAEHGASPTYREIASHMGTALNPTYQIIHHLQARGAISQRHRQARSIVVLSGAVA